MRMHSTVLRGIQPVQQARPFRCEHFDSRAQCSQVSTVKKGYFGGSCQRVGGIVGGHHHLRLFVPRPVLQPEEERIAGRAIQGGKGLVQKQQSRTRRQRPGQGNALGLTAGQIPWPTVSEIRCIDQVQHLGDAGQPDIAAFLPEAIGDIRFHGQVREQGRLLRDKGCLPMAGLSPDAGRRVGERFAVKDDAYGMSARGSGEFQPCQQTQQRRLPRARRPEDHRPLGGKAAVDVEVKCATAHMESHFKHGCLHGDGRRDR